MGAGRDGKGFSTAATESRQNSTGQDNLRHAASRAQRSYGRVPTHVVGVAQERRLYPRANLRLPVRVKRVAGQLQTGGRALVTRDISPSGVYFLFPEAIEPGTPLELEIGLVDRPLGRGSVRMSTEAHVVRLDTGVGEGWHGLAVSFDDITFYRDEVPGELTSTR